MLKRFLKQYPAHSPMQTDRWSLARNEALWSAIQTPRVVFCLLTLGYFSLYLWHSWSAMLLCERLQGTLDQYFTQWGDIFNFQFQLIEAMAGIVCENLARGLAESLQESRDVMSGAQLLTTFFSTKWYSDSRFNFLWRSWIQGSRTAIQRWRNIKWLVHVG